MDLKILFRLGLMMLLTSAVYADENTQAERLNAAYQSYQQHINANQPTEALPYAKQAYELGLKYAGDESQKTAALAYNYGLNLLAVRDYPNAFKALRKAVKLYENVYGKHSHELIPVLTDTEKANLRSTSQTKYRHFKKALKISEQHFGAESLEFANLNLTVGTALLGSLQARNAKRYLDIAHNIFKEKLDETDARLGLAKFQLGKNELSFRRYNNALTHLNKALSVFEQSSADNDLALSTRGFLVVAYEKLEQRDAATEHCLAIGKMTPFTNTQEYKPLVKVAPSYPLSAAHDRKEGYVIVEYDVDEAGFVVNPKVIETGGNNRFKRASLEAAKKFRYAPAFKDGEPVVTAGVQNKFVYTFL